MPIDYCEVCGRYIDLDTDVEHSEEHTENGTDFLLDIENEGEQNDTEY